MSSLARLLGLRSLVLCLAVALFFSCAKRPIAPPAVREEACPARTLAALKKNWDGIAVVRATLNITVSVPGLLHTRAQAGLVAAAAKRSRLRLYAGPSAICDFVRDGDSFSMFVPAKRTLASGTLGSDSVASSAKALLDAVGFAVFPEPFCVTECNSRRLGDVCLVEQRSAGGLRILEIDARTGRLSAVRVWSQEGDEIAEIRYEGYRRTGNREFPYRTTIQLRSFDLRVVLAFDRADVGGKPKRRDFVIDVPPGTKSVAIEELDWRHLLSLGGQSPLQ
ncbi:MAG: DUF4292 domain-containing protein [Candidatus Eisenbacteria bacterium]